MTSKEFYQQFSQGILGDESDLIIWPGLYEMLLQNEANLQELKWLKPIFLQIEQTIREFPNVRYLSLTKKIYNASQGYINAEMLNPYIKLYIQADENRRSLREIKFPSCDKIKLT